MAPLVVGSGGGSSGGGSSPDYDYDFPERGDGTPLPWWIISLLILFVVLIYFFRQEPEEMEVSTSRRDPPPAYHIRNQADYTSLVRAKRYILKYPAITKGEALPLIPKKIEMLEPHGFADFPFLGIPPKVVIEDGLVGINSQSFCTIQSNMPTISFTVKILKLDPRSKIYKRYYIYWICYETLSCLAITWLGKEFYSVSF